MKIALAYNLLDSVSGEKTFFNNIRRALADNGIETVECAIRNSGSFFPLNSLEFYSRIPTLPNAYKQLKKFQDCDVVHFLNSSLSPVGPYLENNVKIATLHHFAPMYYELSASADTPSNALESLYCRYISMLEKKAFSDLDCLVTCTDYPQDFVEKEYGLPKSRMRTIYSGVDVNYFRKIPETDVKSKYGCDEIIVYVGRLHERPKGISYLIRAMKLVNRKNLKLLIIGDGPDKQYYEKLIAELDLQSKILILGELGFDEKSSIQKSADAVIMPSVFELFGTVFAESLACGTPVIAFDMPFWKGLYDDAGLFVNPKDPAALAEGINRLLDDRALSKQLISKGNELVIKYDLKKVISDYISLYEEFV